MCCAIASGSHRDRGRIRRWVSLARGNSCNAQTSRTSVWTLATIEHKRERRSPEETSNLDVDELF